MKREVERRPNKGVPDPGDGFEGESMNGPVARSVTERPGDLGNHRRGNDNTAHEGGVKEGKGRSEMKRGVMARGRTQNAIPVFHLAGHHDSRVAEPIASPPPNYGRFQSSPLRE